MKADKILFGASCLVMGFLLNSVANKPSDSFSNRRPASFVTNCADTLKMKQPLLHDTAVFSNVVKNDSVKTLTKMVK